MGPQGTPAALSFSTHSAPGRCTKYVSSTAFNASLFFDRAAAVAYAGSVSSASAPIAWQSRSHIVPPTAATLMWPSLVLKTPVGMLVGWLFPACFGTSRALSQRDAWKSSMKIWDG